jgi:trehalose 6-phosphate phosphatase
VKLLGPAEPTIIPVERAALFVDIDGTIMPVAEKPDEMKASPACRIVFKRARDHLCGRLAVLSGRTIASIDAVLGGVIGCVAGVHGLQRRTPLGRVHLERPHSRVADAAAELDALARARPGLLVERKGPSVAIHYGGAKEAEAAVLEAVGRLSNASGLIVQRGRYVAELRTPGPDKGSALARFMCEVPFVGAVPVFLGDGLADEPGFAEASKRGGAGVLIGAAKRTRATGRLESPVAALSWIMRSLDRGFFDLRETRDATSI